MAWVSDPTIRLAIEGCWPARDAGCERLRRSTPEKGERSDRQFGYANMLDRVAFEIDPDAFAVFASKNGFDLLGQLAGTFGPRSEPMPVASTSTIVGETRGHLLRDGSNK